MNMRKLKDEDEPNEEAVDMTLRDQAVTLLDAFLAEGRSRSSGGFAPVHKTDVEKLWDIFVAILEAKYERDPDGDLPIRFELTDWTRFEFRRWLQLPQMKRIDQLEDPEARADAWADRLRAALANMRQAAEIAAAAVVELERDERRRIAEAWLEEAAREAELKKMQAAREGGKR